MKPNYKRMILIITSLVLLAIGGYIIVNISVDNYQLKRNRKLIEELKANNYSSKILVVFFSRSGNTELMARKIAEIKQAHVIPIESERNNIGFKGMVEAVTDARKTTAEISPSKIDLSRYDTIYMGSPIWLYSPAPQVFEFAKNNDFTGKKVILFNSMNSKFEQKYIDNFKNTIEQNGGTFEKHIFIIRGRMAQQMEVETFLSEVENSID